MTDPNTPQPRWWRRNRDLAQAAVREAYGRASTSLLALDAAQSNLSDLVAAHQDVVASLRRDRSAAHDVVVTEWQQVSDETATAIEMFVSGTREYDQHADIDEVVANDLTARFDRADTLMRSATSNLSIFQQRNGKALDKARELVASAPIQFDHALAALSAAQKAVQSNLAAGFMDPALDQSIREVVTQAETAQVALAERRWTAAAKESEKVRHAAVSIQQRAQALPALAQEVRHGVLALKTRKEALAHQNDELHPVMSELRRRYTYASWEQVDQAPQKAEAALIAVSDGLDRLTGLLETSPLNVPAAADLLRETRAQAKQIGEMGKEARRVLAELNDVSANPDGLIRKVRREAGDARKFINNLPPRLHDRYAPTYNALSKRVDRLEDDVKENRPDWGAVLREATAIEQSLDLMIRTARSEL